MNGALIISIDRSPVDYLALLMGGLIVIGRLGTRPLSHGNGFSELSHLFGEKYR